MKKFTGAVAALIATFFYQSLCYARITLPKAVGDNMVLQRDTSIRKQLFDYSWKFFLGDIPEARSKDFRDEGWRNLDLPHDWSIEGKISPKNPTGSEGGYFPAGIGWYRKTFQVPKEWKGKHISIYFEGVYMNSEVFINGKSLGIYPYGYSSFSYDLSPFLEFGQENVIAVRVDNSQQVNSRWYSGSGIYRHVWMMVTGPVHVAHWGVAISTPGLTSKRATVQVKTLVKNETAISQSIVLKTLLWNKDSKNVGNDQIKVELPANSEKEIESATLQTAGVAAKIKLTADRKEILANGEDLIYATIEITDKDGIFQPNAANRLHFKIDGPGVIAGIANADIKDTDPYVGDTRKAWHGRALAIIRSTRSAGDIKLTVSSPGLSESTISIKTFF